MLLEVVVCRPQISATWTRDKKRDEFCQMMPVSHSPWSCDSWELSNCVKDSTVDILEKNTWHVNVAISRQSPRHLDDTTQAEWVRATFFFCLFVFFNVWTRGQNVISVYIETVVSRKWGGTILLTKRASHIWCFNGPFVSRRWEMNPIGLWNIPCQLIVILTENSC